MPRYDNIVRTAGWAGSARAADRWLADDGERSQNCAPYMGSGRGWLAGDWPSTGGVLNITAAAWTSGFLWWRSGNKKRTQNVSEYMLVLALCLVIHYWLLQFLAKLVAMNTNFTFLSLSIIFSVRIIEHWNNLKADVVDFSSLKHLKSSLNKTFKFCLI